MIATTSRLGYLGLFALLAGYGAVACDAGEDALSDAGAADGQPSGGGDAQGCPDTDGDGYSNAACGGQDCNDSDPAVSPGAAEDCGNQIDDDCDGQIDDADSSCVACVPGTDELCGRCGLRICAPGGTWGACQREGECRAGERRDCPEGGEQVCGPLCGWAPCQGEPAGCTPEATEACGDCGTRTCGADGRWGACGDEGGCSPGQTRPCEAVQGGSQACGAECAWGDCEAAPPGACEAVEVSACGRCGTRACVDGAWGPCQGEGVCSPGQTQGCEGGGQQICGEGCGWGACVAPPECQADGRRPCGRCGEQPCVAGAWGACEGEGPCAPGEQRGCDGGGLQICGDGCGWGACEQPAECQAGQSRPCGRCGTQPCGAGGRWGACQGEGECAPGDGRGCDGGAGQQSCDGSCRWGPCTCREGDERACGLCGQQRCGPGGWGPCGNGGGNIWERCGGCGWRFCLPSGDEWGACSAHFACADPSQACTADGRCLSCRALMTDCQVEPCRPGEVCAQSGGAFFCCR